jgi:hypothetical protein
MRFPRLLPLIPCLVLLAGCAGYRLGPTSEVSAGAQSVQLVPFSNQTLQPRLGDAVTVALRHQMQRDGTYHLANEDADIVVTGILTHYDRRELGFLPNDVLTASDYRVNLKARVTARNRRSGETILEREVTAYTLVRVGSDLASAERQALPLLAEDLAMNIVSLLVDGDW